LEKSPAQLFIEFVAKHTNGFNYLSVKWRHSLKQSEV